jgi:CRISPR-associated protein Cmx8
LLRKTEEKTGLEWDKIKEKKTPEGKIDVPKEWSQEKEKLASNIFLEMRSRREQAFVDHFTGTFCSVKQYLPEDDFQIVANELLTDSEKVKTLTLLALSANS